MTGLVDRLAKARAARNAARSAFDSNVAQVEADLAARGIGGRLADTAKAEAKSALDEAAAIASESKGIIAAAGLALALWAFRNPLGAFVKGRFARHDQPDEVQEN